LVNLLLELNLVKCTWKRFGPKLNIRAKNFDKIIKWGQNIHGEDNDNPDTVVQRNISKRKIRSS